MKHPVMIGIAGGSASGKSLIAKKIADYFKDKHTIKIIKLDDYYKDQSHLTLEERILTNYDHPFAFDMDLLVKHLNQLKSGLNIKKPIYDFECHNRCKEIEIVESHDVFILEGLFVLHEPRIRESCDILVYIDTAADIRFIRRLYRDMEERGRSLKSVCDQYLTTVRPMHERFIEPSKKYAHIIIPEGGNNTVAIDLLVTKICSIVEG